MENNCLVTTLKGAVQNDELLKLGEMEFTVNISNNPTTTTQVFSVTGTCEYLKIIGDGYFISSNPGTDHWSDGTNSVGKQVTPSNYGSNSYFLSNGNYKVVLMSKYTSSFRALETGTCVSYSIGDMSYKNTTVNIITNLGKYSTGEILPYLRTKASGDAIALDFRGSGLSFSLKDFLENDVVCDISYLKVASSSIKDQDAATVAAIKTKWPSITIDINPSA